MAYEQEKKFLAEEAATRVSYLCNTRTGAKTLVRRWTTTRKELMASSQTYIETIKTVTNPQADTKVYPGVWRVIANQGPEKKTDPNVQGVTQTLFQGGTVDEVKWSSSESTLDDGYSYFYHNLSNPIQAATPVQGQVTEAKNTLNPETGYYDADAVIVNSHPYQWATHVAENALGTGDVLGYKNFRTRPQAPASTVQGTIYDARSTLNRDGSYDGEVGYETSREKVKAGTVSETALAVGYEVAYQNSRTIPVTPAGTVQGVVYDAKSTVNKDDTYTGGVGYEASKERMLPATVTETALSSNYDISYLNYRTRPVAPAGTIQGILYDAKSTLNKDDTYTGGVGYEASKPRMLDGIVSETALAVGYEAAYVNYRTRPAVPAGTVQGVIYDAKSTVNKDDTYAGGVGYEASKEKVKAGTVSETALAVGYEVAYQNSRTIPVTPAGTVQGLVYDAKSTVNKDDTYTGGVGYEASKEKIKAGTVSDSALAVGYEVAYQNSRTVPVVPAETIQGLVYDAKSTVNKDDTYTGGVGYEASKPRMLDGIVSETALAVGYEAAYVNYRTRPAVPAVTVQGVIYDAKSTVNKDDTYTGGVGYEASKERIIASQVSNSAFSAGYEVAYQNSRTMPVVPAGTVQGVIYDAKSTLNKDDTYTGEVGYQYSKPAELYLTWQSADGLRGLRRYINWPDVPSTIAALTAYTDNSVDGSYSPNGTFQISVHVNPLSSEAGAGAIIGTLDDVILKRHQYRGDFTEYREMTITQSIRMTTSRALAAAFISNSMDKSEIVKSGNTYVAIRYTCTFGAWTDISLEPNIT
ncbi:MAG: hypothetical protein WC551_12780 [Patescibacteria group bacterium]